MRPAHTIVLGLLLAVAAAPGAALEEASPAWQATLDRVVPSVVVMRVSATRSFDTESTTFYTATGFVVDAERGIILTNRHVVSTGPVVAEAVFPNHEEVEVRALYRDPVHDFGFYRFDPKAVRFMKVSALKLAPDRARVGAEVRVVGNDAGEKLSILSGTLARLDREAPNYGRGRYNDFNTFYYQAASSTSGGSSGSPVVDVSGRVVALNAGAKSQAASSYYLPLDRVVRALRLLQQGAPVPRGTLETVFEHRPYDELRRLGLRPDTEADVRRAFPRGTGMLVVDEVVPGGPRDGVLEPGDIVTAIDGERVTTFVPLEARCDERVGGEVHLSLERGGEPLDVTLPVRDLHAITPDAYLEMGGATLNRLSYQQARNYSLPVGGVYVAAPGYMLSRADVPRDAVITAVRGEPTRTLDEFELVMAPLADGTKVPVRYFRLQEPRNSVVAVVRVDRRWHSMRRCTRDDATGIWPCVEAPPPGPPEERPPASTELEVQGDGRTRKLARSLVSVECHIPYRVDGVYGDRFVGAGLVVDAERGLVVVDRDTVPVALADVTLTFAGAVEVPGQILYLHPEHNLAVVSYDPARLGDTPVRSADLHATELEAGDRLWLVGLTQSQQVVSEETHVLRVETPSLPLPMPPRFREVNASLVVLANSPATVGGVLVDRRGRVTALWSSFATHGGGESSAFFAGTPIEQVQTLIEPLQNGTTPEWRSLEVEFRPIPLADARNRGLSEAAAQRLEAHDPKRRRVLSVLRLTTGAPSSALLEEGDLILSANGQPVTRVREIELASLQDGGRIALQVVRDGRELDLDVPVRRLSGRGTDRAVIWAGALLQAPPRSLAAQRGIPQEGVYIAWSWYGSPAFRYRMRATRRILAVDGKPTPDLDAFLAAVAGKADRDSVRLRTVDLDGRPAVITLKLDLQYWPAYELHRNSRGWERRPLAAAPGDG